MEPNHERPGAPSTAAGPPSSDGYRMPAEYAPHERCLIAWPTRTRAYWGDWSAEIYGYNLTDEVVQYWGGADQQVPKGSMSVPRNYGLRIGCKF